MANFSSKIQQSKKYRFLLQNVANSKEKFPRLKNKQKNPKKSAPFF